MFLIKKIIAPFLFPIPLVLIILAIGLFRLWRNHRQVAPKGRMWLTFGFILLVLLSTRPLPTYLLGRLEGQYQTFPNHPGDGTQIQAVVVLGGGVSDDPSLEPIQRLSEATLVRLTEGIRIAREYPDARLIVSGGSAFGSVSEASMMAASARALGFDSTRMVLEERSLDTDDQAQAMASMTKGETFALVTSAYHMPRAMRLFGERKLEPIPAPTNRLVKHSTTLHPGAYFPSSINLEHARILFRESLGLVWANLVEWAR